MQAPRITPATPEQLRAGIRDRLAFVEAENSRYVVDYDSDGERETVRVFSLWADCDWHDEIRAALNEHGYPISAVLGCTPDDARGLIDWALDDGPRPDIVIDSEICQLPLSTELAGALDDGTVAALRGAL